MDKSVIYTITDNYIIHFTPNFEVMELKIHIGKKGKYYEYIKK